MLKSINIIRNAVTPLGAILLMFFMTLSSPVAAQDFQKGYAAYQAGDFATAIQELTPLAEVGNASAQYYLGNIYSDGQGVPQDNAEAVQWYRLAADQGNAFAQYNLGNMYINGQGVPQDPAEAVKWFRLAAEQGYAFAQYNLGVMYGNGRGIPQDPAEAVKWYRLAAEQGHTSAQYNLGYMYESGVFKDYVMAHMWFNIASANGHHLADMVRDSRADRMTPADVSKAQAMASKCMGSGFKKCGY